MIQISKIDNNLSVYKKNNVIIYGAGKETVQIVEMLQAQEVTISAICDSTIGDEGEFSGVELISIEELHARNGQGTIIQLATTYQTLLQGENIITYEEALQVVNFINKLKLLKQFPQMLTKLQKDNAKLKETQTANIRKTILKATETPLVLLCLPTKTGDHTLMETFSSIGIPFHILWHTPEMFLKDEFSNLDKPIKMITAVREPISRDISFLYQCLEFIVSSPMIDKLNLQLKTPHVMAGGGDAQQIFDLHFNSKKGSTPMVDFFQKFDEHILKLTDYPFDHELGYTIIKEGNLEVFVYQLEKLDSLATAMGDWLDTPIEHFVSGNTADSKWIANSYEQAKSDIVLAPEYYEKCYSSEWVKHFYSKEDIDKFKAHWSSNIK